MNLNNLKIFLSNLIYQVSKKITSKDSAEQNLYKNTLLTKKTLPNANFFNF